MTDQLRETLTNAGRVLVGEDQGDYVAGHITVRLPADSERFLMKPAGIGLDEITARFEAEHDDYRSIIAKALADRLAEAFAEYLHEVAREEWYEQGDKLSTEQLIAERFRGIRPAFGYPACPDHSEKRKLFDLLGAEEVGISLTESGAMIPPASVSGIYLGHPEVRYFSVGRVGPEQVPGIRRPPVHQHRAAARIAGFLHR